MSSSGEGRAHFLLVSFYIASQVLRPADWKPSLCPACIAFSRGPSQQCFLCHQSWETYFGGRVVAGQTESGGQVRRGLCPSPLSLSQAISGLTRDPCHPVTPTWTDRTSNRDRSSRLGVETRNSRDLDLSVSGVWQSHESSSPSLCPACEGAWHQSQKALNKCPVGSWESSNKINVNIANI